MSHCTKQEQKSAEQISMTGNKFLNWFERWSMDGLCESSFRPQLGVMRVAHNGRECPFVQNGTRRAGGHERAFFDPVRPYWPQR
jgi:hypothetical protein